MRVEKRKGAAVYGLQLEANRTPADHERGRDFDASDIDWSRTADNVYLVKADNWKAAINEQLKAAHIKPKSNSVVALDGLYTASSAWIANQSREEQLKFFKDCLAFHAAHYGPVINAVIHFDEKTPHMHVHFRLMEPKEHAYEEFSHRNG